MRFLKVVEIGLAIQFLVDKFAYEARRTGRAKDFKVWKDDNHAIDLDGGGIGKDRLYPYESRKDWPG